MSFAQLTARSKWVDGHVGFGAETRAIAVSKDSDDFAEESRASFSVDVGNGGG
jgi:hypothetical protein